MKALKTHATPSGSIAFLSDLPIPALPSPEWILIRTVAVALNPTDWKTIKQLDVQATVGCDFAGVVEEVGPGVNKELGLEKGSRVCGAVHGCCRMHGDRGAFGEWIVTKGDLVVGIPDGELNLNFQGEIDGKCKIARGVGEDGSAN
jgi:NADPH:quinone reductase-like Zn-dependent oxidoreductase